MSDCTSTGSTNVIYDHGCGGGRGVSIHSIFYTLICTKYDKNDKIIPVSSNSFEFCVWLIYLICFLDFILFNYTVPVLVSVFHLHQIAKLLRKFVRWWTSQGWMNFVTLNLISDSWLWFLQMWETTFFT